MLYQLKKIDNVHITKKSVLTLVAVISSFAARANFPEAELFNAHVKSVDEFTARFNGDEANEVIATAVTEGPGNHILHLFDVDYVNSQDPVQNKQLASEFVDAVVKNNSKIGIDKPSTKIIAVCSFLYKGSPVTLNLIFQREEFKSGYKRLALIDVQGLDSLHIYKPNSIYPINPLEYEMHFMEFDDVLNDKTEYIEGIISSQKALDPLTLFIMLMKNKELKYVQCDDVQMVFNEVPGFVFTVREVVHPESYYSGWLITDLRKK